MESSPFTENKIQHDFKLTDYKLTEEGIPSSCPIEAHLSPMLSWAVSLEALTPPPQSSECEWVWRWAFTEVITVK